MIKEILKNKNIIIVFGVLALLLAIFLIGKSHATLTEVKSVEFSSSGYANNEPGSWHITKSADWTASDTARVRFDVDTIIKSYDRNKDILLIIDNSGSMSGEKLNRVKEDAINLINNLLSINGNKIALISFESDSTILSDFTDNKDELVDLVNNLRASGCTNYNAALKNALILMENYIKEEDKDLKMLFLTDGFPNTDVPNQIATYEILKEKHPYMEVNGIQYEMGKEIIQDIINISDLQYIADKDTLNNILLDASLNKELYDEFIVTDYVNNEYFFIKSVDNIKVSQGTVSLEDENGTQKIIWNLGEKFSTGQKAWMNIDLTLKEEYLNTDEFYPTNKKETVVSKVVDEEEQTVNETATPILSRYYNVIYDNNAPSGCSIPNIENYNQKHYIYERVTLEDEELMCAGWAFKGWYIINNDVNLINSDVFKMPAHDVIVKAKWGKHDLSKSMDGSVKTANTFAMLSTGQDINVKMKTIAANETRSNNDTDTLITGFRKSSALPSSFRPSNSNTISTYNSLYPIYIWFDSDTGIINYYTEADTIYLNSDSSRMFMYLDNLIDISGLEYFDSSRLTNIKQMFNKCRSLADISVLANLDVSSVTSMEYLFTNSSITTLDALSNWDVSSVTSMENLFADCESLTDFNGISNWDVSSVTNMGNMFNDCKGLTDLTIISNWNVSSATSMWSMFFGCTGLTDLTPLSNWNTSSVTNIGQMFYNCKGLINISGLSNWNVSLVTNMQKMFSSCILITSLESLSNWNVSSVTNMGGMFSHCDGLTSLAGLENWNVSSVTDMNRMFDSCDYLVDASAINDWDITSVIFTGNNDSNNKFWNMFLFCKDKPVFTKREGTWNGGTFVPTI